MVNEGLTSALSSSNSFADDMSPRRSPQETTEVFMSMLSMLSRNFPALLPRVILHAAIQLPYQLHST
jgi:hypothetical protein